MQVQLQMSQNNAVNYSLSDHLSKCAFLGENHKDTNIYRYLYTFCPVEII